MLSVHEVTTAYQGLVAISAVSIDVAKGEIVCVAGANGAGKSTLLKTIAGAERSPGVRCCRTSRCPPVHPLLIKPMQPPQTEERRPERFAAYIAARRFDPPRPLLIRAAGLAEPKDHALDAGAGALNATRYLLSAGFKHVTALDSSPASQTAAAELPTEQVRFVLSRFEDFDYRDRAYEFVNAEFSLPFISAAAVHQADGLDEDRRPLHRTTIRPQ